MAVPSNIDKELRVNNYIMLYDLDSISAELQHKRETRLKALGDVNEIIDAELLIYFEWFQTAALRSSLAKYKTIVHQKVKDYFQTKSEENNLDNTKRVTNRIMRKIMKLASKELISVEVMNAVIDEQLALSNKQNLVSLH